MIIIDYVKHNTNRCSQYALSTTIETVNGRRQVKKFSTSDISTRFISTIESNYLLLKKAYNTVNICICIKGDNNKEIIFDFIDGRNFSFILTEFVNSGNKEQFLEALFLYKSIVLDFGAIKVMESDIITPEFVKIFGDYEGSRPFNHIEVSNIDVNFKNLIVNNNNSYTMIDYEWVFDFPIPLNYILFRSIDAFYQRYCSKAIQLYSREFVFSKVLNLSEKDINAFRKMEANFAKHVGNEAHLNKIQSGTGNLVEFSRKYSTIYVYGAGFFASSVNAILSSNGVDFSGFIVSDGTANPSAYYSKPVFYLSEIDLIKDDIGIILALNKANQDEVLKLLPQSCEDRIFLF